MLLSVKFQPADLKQHILVSLVEQSMDQKIVRAIVKENAISGNVFFRIFPLARTQRLTAINTPNIQSFPVISGILMAAVVYTSLVKGCTSSDMSRYLQTG